MLYNWQDYNPCNEATNHNTPTPRTNKKATNHIGFYTCATVPADFASQLERELTEKTNEIARLRDEIQKLKQK